MIRRRSFNNIRNSIFIPKVSLWKIRRREYKTDIARFKYYILFFALVLFAILSLVVFIPPDSFSIVSGFLLLVFVAIAIPAYLLTKNVRRSVFAGVAVVFILAMRAVGVGNLLNVSLLLAALVAFEIYYSR